MSGRARVAVVGGGAAGLAAAERLRRGGAEVVVFEARPWAGGRIRTDTVDGYRIDTYTQMFGSVHAEALELIRAAGIEHLLRRMPGRDAVWRNGRAHEVVYGSLASMLSTGAVPMATKLRLGSRYLGFLNAHADQLDLHAPQLAAAAGLDGESVAAWGARELGGDFVEYLAYPLLASYCGVAPEQVTAGLYHILARSGSDVEMYAVGGGVGRLAERLVERLREAGGEVRLSTEVREITAGSGSVTVSSDAGSERFDGVAVCVAGVEVPLLLPDLPPVARRWFEAVRYQPLASLALLLDAPVGVRYFGLSFTRHDSRVVATACIQENKDPELVPDGAGLVVVFPAPESARLFVDSAPESVLAAVLPDLQRAVPGIRRRIRRAKLYRWPTGGPVFYPGYLDHLRVFEEGGVEGAGRIVFAGDYLAIPAAEGSFRSGRLAAERLLRRLED